jgi:hypothetical protein
MNEMHAISGGFFKASSKDLDSHGAIATESRS